MSRNRSNQAVFLLNKISTFEVSTTIVCGVGAEAEKLFQHKVYNSFVKAVSADFFKNDRRQPIFTFHVKKKCRMCVRCGIDPAGLNSALQHLALNGGIMAK